MILIDAGPIIAIFDGDDIGHAACVAALPAAVPLVTTWPCFAEAMYILRRELGYPGQEALWQLHATGQLIIHESGLAEQERMRALMDEYQDIPMDLADASLVAAAETRNVRRVFTLDRHFYAYRTAGGHSFEVVP
jgi:predicted nucleic acid-binding protein